MKTLSEFQELVKSSEWLTAEAICASASAQSDILTSSVHFSDGIQIRYWGSLPVECSANCALLIGEALEDNYTKRVTMNTNALTQGLVHKAWVIV